MNVIMVDPTLFSFWTEAALDDHAPVSKIFS